MWEIVQGGLGMGDARTFEEHNQVVVAVGGLGLSSWPWLCVAPLTFGLNLEETADSGPRLPGTHASSGS
jgi:hypothetical protein